MKKIFFVLIVCCSIMQANAQRYMVSTDDLFFSLEPTESDFRKVTVRNMSDVPQAYQVTIGDFMVNEKGEISYSAANTTPNSCADWVSVSKSLFELEPNESQEVIIGMKVPEGALDTRWAAVYIEPSRERIDLASIDKGLAMGVQNTTRVAVKLFQSPKSDTYIAASITDLKIQEGTDAQGKYTVTVENKCKKVIQAKLFVILADLETAKEENYEPIGINVLPGMKKIIPVSVEEGTKPGNYLLSVILDYGLEDQLEGVQQEIEIKE